MLLVAKMDRLSKIFQPLIIIPRNATAKKQDITSKSQRLLLEMGLIRNAGNGTFHLLPLLQRSLDKCISLLDKHLRRVDAQKMTLPSLTSVELWKKSGRLKDDNPELMILHDRHDNAQILSPTHEESICALLATMAPISYRQFPLRLYQITPKFRDEMKPRFGLMRAKEFLMKDLYTFDVGPKEAQLTYEEVTGAYEAILKEIGVPFVRVCGDNGAMGGSYSHEFHFPSAVGEDRLAFCKACGAARNVEVNVDCNRNDCRWEEQLGIEVAHTFILEDRYSKRLQATYLNQQGKPVPLLMGCYGIGVTRLIQAGIECLSSEEEIRWPFALAPYKVCLIAPKRGSKEEQAAEPIVRLLRGGFEEMRLTDVIQDDRDQMTIGKRLTEAKRTGYPLIVVLGKEIVNETPKIELHDLVSKEELHVEPEVALKELKIRINSYIS